MNHRIALTVAGFGLIVVLLFLVDRSGNDEPQVTAAPETRSVQEQGLPPGAEQPTRAPVGGTHSKEQSDPIDSVPDSSGPAQAGTVTLGQRIDRFVEHFEQSDYPSPVSFSIELLGRTYPVKLMEFTRVEGSAGSGVFFGQIEGQNHSRVAWAFHGEAENAEISVHGEDTVKIIYGGSGREHRVLAWDPKELGKCALCAAEQN